jgi:hypothetical protein
LAPPPEQASADHGKMRNSDPTSNRPLNHLQISATGQTFNCAGPLSDLPESAPCRNPPAPDGGVRIRNQ